MAPTTFRENSDIYNQNINSKDLNSLNENKLIN